MDPVAAKALSLAGKIANNIVARWLREQTEPGGTRNITSAFKKYIPEPLAQRRAQLQLERVSLSIAEQMQSVFKIEGAQLEEASLSAVADAVSQTLDKIYLTTQVLAEQNLDPTKLVRLCREMDPAATRDFSELEQEFYGSVLSYAAQFICDTASRLPAFTEKTLGEILAREDVILSKFNEIAANFQRIHETLSNSSNSVLRGKFEADFRLATVRRLSELSLFGLDVSETSKHYSLTVAYVALAVQKRAAIVSKQQALKVHQQNDVDVDELEQTISIEDGLESPSGKTLIIGHAGSGKTTLLQWLAVQAASRSLEGKLSKYNDCVPFFIRLRDFANSALPAPESFASLTAPEIGGRMPNGWAHEKLAQAQAILLVDGVDELPRSQRNGLREWVIALHAEYPEVSIFLTSRPYASNDEWYEHNGFSKAELQSMDLARTGEFIDHWHDAIKVQLNSDAQRAVLAPLAHGLKTLIGTQPRLAELASTPLLCAMICALYRDRNQRLPSDRVGLYRACIEALVDRRDPERRISLSDYPDLSFRHKILLLQDFAYYLIRNGLAEAPQDQLESRIASRLPSLGVPPFIGTQAVSRLLVERSGVLREVVAGRVDFIHKTFQEFLAAQAILDEGDVGLLVKNASDDEWREVIVLAAGLAPARVTDQVIAELIQEGDKLKARRHQLHLLAVGCLGAAAATSEALRDEVGKRIKALVPPTNLREAKELAAAGDLAVPFLQRTGKKLKAQHAAACVRALSLVGSDTAFDALKTYVNDNRQVVRQELFKAWSSFPVDEYARSFFKDESYITVKPGVPLSALRELKKVKSLFVDGAVDFNATSLVHMQQLENLTVHGGRAVVAADLQNLSELVSLRRLSLWKIAVASLPSFDGFKQLGQVVFTDLPVLKGIEELLNAKSLENIQLSGLPGVDEIPPFRELKNLHEISIRNVGRKPMMLDGCFPERLESLDLEAFNGFSDFDFLKDLTAVTYFRLNSREKGGLPQTLLSNMAHLAPHFRSIHLSRVDGVVDFSVLALSSQLELLSLDSVGSVSHVNSLNACHAPIKIEFQGLSRDFDFSGLAELERPFHLSIRFSLFGVHEGLDLSPLLECESLSGVSFDYVQATQKSKDVVEMLEKRIPVYKRALLYREK